MTVKLELYRCKVCGNIAQIMVSGEGNLVCCGQEMGKIEPNYEETNLNEKHIPIFEQNEQETLIKVGSIPHPMEEKHYIQFIQAISHDRNCTYTKFLSPNDKPEAKIPPNCEIKCAIEYCNIHSLFKSEK